MFFLLSFPSLGDYDGPSAFSVLAHAGFSLVRGKSSSGRHHRRFAADCSFPLPPANLLQFVVT
jgi:hypothetical protein